MNGPSRAAALPRTPATNPAETFTPVRDATRAAARATGREWGESARAARSCTPGPYWTRPVTSAGARPTVTAPQFPHALACTWYSITFGGGGGDASNTCRFCTAVTSASLRSAPQQPHTSRAADHRLAGVSGLLQRRGLRSGLPAGTAPGPAPQRPVPGLLLIRAIRRRRRGRHMGQKPP